MSWAFVTAMKKNPQQSYVQLLNSIRDELATKYSQKPQLSCSHPLGEWAASTSAALTLRHESALRHVVRPARPVVVRATPSNPYRNLDVHCFAVGVRA
jgi:hypothetical protein